MARQHFACGAIAMRHHFPPKEWERSDGVVLDVTPMPGRTYTKDTWPPRGRGRGESLSSDRRIEAKLRGARAMQMYFREGYTWQQVANALGFADRSGPWRAVRRATDRADFDRVRRAELKKGT